MLRQLKNLAARYGGPGGRRGLALVTVLWVLMLLSLVAASFMATTRLEINLTRNLIESAKAEALADAGIYWAIYGLRHPQVEERWRAVDGTVRVLQFDGGEILVAAQDEGGKIDLNVASDELLRGLLLTAEWAGPDGEPTGLDEAEADVLVDAIRDFADEDDLTRLNGAEDGDYEAAGLPWGAKDGPFEAVEELQQVLGMTAVIYEKVAPTLTVHTGQPAINPATAPREVLLALPGIDVAEADTLIAERSGAVIGLGAAGKALLTGLDDYLSEKRLRTYTIRSEAHTQSGAVFVREAVVRLTGDLDRMFLFLSWRRGSRSAIAVEPDTDAVVE